MFKLALCSSLHCCYVLSYLDAKIGHVDLPDEETGGLALLKCQNLLFICLTLCRGILSIPHQPLCKKDLARRVAGNRLREYSVCAASMFYHGPSLSDILARDGPSGYKLSKEKMKKEGCVQHF